MRDATCVVLAAGLAMRMGGEKLLLPFRGGTILSAVLEACAAWPTVVVTSAGIAEALPEDANRTVLINQAPQRGMTHSLWMANRAIAPDRPIAVLLGDKPLVTADLIERVLEALDEDVDVVYPVCGELAGHPVAFSARARSIINVIPDGDTLKKLRDEPRLVRRPLETEDEGAYVDIDTEENYEALLRPG
jgi:molybdenum cofactor cytidylyltransferase